MVPKLNMPPPMDLSSERLIPSPKISPSNNLQESHCKCFTRNDAVTRWNYTVGAREWVGPIPRSTISSKGLQTDLSKERETPPLKIADGGGVVNPHCNTLQHNIILLQK